MAKDRVKDVEAALEREKQERADAETRATRANERAREADEAYRKLQLELVNAKDEALSAREAARALEDRIAQLEAAAAARPGSGGSKTPPRTSSVPAKAQPPTVPAHAQGSVAPMSAASQTNAQVEAMLARIEGLRELLATASIELSQLNADEVALAKKRSRVLTDACALLARAIGATGQAPPPIPSAALEARLTVAPVVDISEVADLLESLRPPRAPKVE